MLVQSYIRKCRKPWLICLSAGLFFFYEFFQLNLFDVINQRLRSSFHIDATQVSWMSSTFVWANLFFLLPAGFILDRFPAHRVILSALFVCLLGTIGFGLAPSFAWAAFFHSLTGVGNAFCFLSCVVLVLRWFPPNRQALVIGCIVTMAFVGGMVALTPFAYLNTLVGWRQAIFIDVLFGVLIFIWIAIFVRDKREPTKSARPIDLNLKQTLLNPQNLLAGIYTACLNLPIMVLCALWGENYLQTTHHMNNMTASRVISFIYIGSILGCPLVGWLSDLQGRRKPLMIVGALATGIIVLFLLTGQVMSQLTLSIFFFLLGLFTSTQVISYPLIAESNHPDNAGAATGIASMIVMGGGGVGQVLFGMLMQYHADGAILRYSVSDFQHGMWIFPIAAMIALLSTFKLRETFCH